VSNFADVPYWIVSVVRETNGNELSQARVIVVVIDRRRYSLRSKLSRRARVVITDPAAPTHAPYRSRRPETYFLFYARSRSLLSRVEFRVRKLVAYYRTTVALDEPHRSRPWLYYIIDVLNSRSRPRLPFDSIR